jgi:hypothetical protein
MADRRSRRRSWLFPALLLLGVAVVVGLAFMQRRAGLGRIDAHCDVAALEARAPRIELARTDEAVLELGGEAIADVLEFCPGLPEWTKHGLRAEAAGWSPRISELRYTTFGDKTPSDVTALYARVCGSGWSRSGDVFDLPGRERGLALYELCGFERLELLSREDTDYVDPGLIRPWALHQILLDSGLSADAARRYFLAFVTATDTSERAPGQFVVRDGAIEYEGSFERVREELGDDGLSVHSSPRTLFSAGDNECWAYSVSVATDEPMRNLIWVLNPPEIEGECALLPALELAILERDELLRPLRAELDFPTHEAVAELELQLDASGAWQTTDGRVVGHDAELLPLTLAQRRPASLRIRVPPETPAKIAVNLARVADVWRSREHVNMKLWLSVDSPTPGDGGGQPNGLLEN